MTDAMDWQGRVGESWASEWRRTDRSFTNLTPKLLDTVFADEVSEVLDIGCGAGELSLLIAERKPTARVVGLDLSPALIGVARERGAGKSNLRFCLGNAAEALPSEVADLSPDTFVSRHGVMFFADPVSAFSNIRAQAQGRTGRLIFSCFRQVADNPFFVEPASIMPSAGTPADPHAPGPLAFADPDRVKSILVEAGWSNIEFERHDFQMIAGAGPDPVADAVSYFSRIGPAARMMADAVEAERSELKNKLASIASKHLDGGQVTLGASTWIVTARTG